MTLPDRTQAPPFRLSSDFSLPRPEVFQLALGRKLFAFRGLQQEVVKLDLIFDAGKWFEPTPGVSHFTSQMLSKGTHAKNSFQIAEALDSLGAHLEISPGFDWVALSLFTLRKNLFPALSLVLELLEGPSFDGVELRQMKEIFLQNLKVNNEKTNIVASKEIRKTIFGEKHPYGSSAEENDVKRIEREDMEAFFRKHFSLHSVFLVGRLSDKEVDEVIRIIPVSGSEDIDPRRPERHPGVSHIITKPGSVQVSIRVGKRCLVQSHTEEYFNAAFFNHVLGGFFGSRLMKNIREEKGLTYGIYSAMNHFLRDSFWVVGADVNQKNAETAIGEIKHEIKKLQDELMSLDELEIAKNYFIGSWQSENSTLFAVAEKVKTIHAWGLPENYYVNLLEHIEKITPAQIQFTANHYFDGVDLFEIQVG